MFEKLPNRLVNLLRGEGFSAERVRRATARREESCKKLRDEESPYGAAYKNNHGHLCVELGELN